ncbi:uncharacterized protein LOC144381304 [Halichoerus grypus]
MGKECKEWEVQPESKQQVKELPEQICERQQKLCSSHSVRPSSGDSSLLLGGDPGSPVTETADGGHGWRFCKGKSRLEIFGPLLQRPQQLDPATMEKTAQYPEILNFQLPMTQNG